MPPNRFLINAWTIVLLFRHRGRKLWFEASRRSSACITDLVKRCRRFMKKCRKSPVPHISYFSLKENCLVASKSIIKPCLNRAKPRLYWTNSTWNVSSITCKFALFWYVHDLCYWYIRLFWKKTRKFWFQYHFAWYVTFRRETVRKKQEDCGKSFGIWQLA